MEQNGAVVVAVATGETQETENSTTSKLTANDAKALQKQLMTLFQKKKGIEKTRQEIDNEIEDINQKLVAFYDSKEKEPEVVDPLELLLKELNQT